MRWKHLAAFGFLTIVLLLVAARTWAAFQKDFTWQEMDWNSDGTTTASEFIRSTDIGVRKAIIDGKECAEYYAYKDAATIKKICN
jgi:hypothetical protein